MVSVHTTITQGNGIISDATIARRIRLRDLHTLRILAETGSMARAAEILHLSQPAISKAMAEMERLVGAVLLERSARGVAITRQGEVLMLRGIAMLDEMRRGMEEIRFLSDPATGEVRVGCTEPMAAVAGAAIARLAPRYPRMVFQVEVSDTLTLFRWLREREIDVAITRMGAVPEPDLDAETLFEDPLVVMAGRRHPLRRRQKLELADLTEEAWTLPPADSFLSGIIGAAFRNRGLDLPRRIVVVRTVHARVSLLRAGRFLDMLPGAMLRFPEQYPGIAALPVALPETRRPIALVTLTQRMPTPAARLFAETARGVVR